MQIDSSVIIIIIIISETILSSVAFTSLPNKPLTVDRGTDDRPGRGHEATQDSHDGLPSHLTKFTAPSNALSRETRSPRNVNTLRDDENP